MKTVEVVAAIIIYNGKILCAKRGESKYEYISHKYEFPGGKVEEDETKVEALKREIREEMDMIIEASKEDFFLTVNHQYPDFCIDMHSYICKVSSDCFVMKEHVDYKWLELDELNTLDWAAADLPIVDKLVRDGFDGAL